MDDSRRADPSSPETAFPVFPDRPDRPLPRWAFLLFAFVYLYSFPYFESLRSANEMPRVLTTQELVERGTFRIDARLQDMGSTFDTSRGVDGHLYSNKAPGPSLLAVPVYAALKLLGATSVKVSVWAFRVFAVSVPALLFLPLFYRLTGRFAPEEPARRAALCAYALGSSALPYSILFMSHQLAAVCLGGAFVAAVTLVRGQPRHPDLLRIAVGALCATAVLMDYQTLFIAPYIGLYVLVRGPGRLRTVAFVAAGILPLAIALGAYHKVHFGSALSTPLASSNEAATKSGFMGLIGPNAPAFFVLLLDPSNGLFVLMPWVVFAAVGAAAIALDPEARRSCGAEALTCALIVTTYVLVLGSLVPSYARAGWTVGPRYLGASLPFLGWLTASGFAVAYRRLATRVVAQGLVLAAVAIFVVAISTFPHWPDGLKNPIFELAFRLAAHGYAARSLGTAIGLRGFWALLPLYLTAAGLAGWLLLRRGRHALTGGILAVAIAASTLAAYSTFPPTGKYSDRAWTFATAIWEPKRR